MKVFSVLRPTCNELLYPCKTIHLVSWLPIYLLCEERKGLLPLSKD